jgi:glycosyltransferase involved in cell wall biosynthesis
MSRNELCACGSGKRVKHCHGAIASGIAAGTPSALHFEALAVHRTGALRQAEALYRRAIERDPADLDSVHMLGVVHFERMRYREALELLWDACERSGWGDAVFRHNLGLVLAKLLTPQANERQEALVRAYMARERERRAAPVVHAQVSVILTVRDQARFIGRAIDSVAAQTYRNLELIVVDDGSTDETPALIARRLPGLDVPARFMRTTHRSEPRAANEGAACAQGRYLGFLRGDEWFAPRRIERMVAEMARAAPLWGFSRVAYPAGGSSPAGEVAARPGESFGSEPASFMFMIPNVIESNSNLFMERQLFNAFGGFRDVAEHGADLRERAASDVEPVIIHERLYFRDERSDAAASRAAQAAADAQLSRALASDVMPANPFSPLHPDNRDVLLRAALRAGRGDCISLPLLRSVAAEWRTRTTTPRLCSERTRSTNAKTAIVVLGPYRSGTSALARVLNLCGAFLPQRVVAARLGINPKGFWETEAVNDLNGRLMQYLCADWNRVEFALPNGGPLLEEFLLNGRDVLESEYADSPLILIKDPRICVLAPLWHRALQENGYRPVYVVCVRNPLEVARSLGNDMPTSRGLALWSDYMRPVEAFVATPDVRAVHVRYADLLDDWRSVVHRIACGLAVPLAIESHASEVDVFLEADLRNHRASDSEFDQQAVGAEGGIVRELYRRMVARCGLETLNDRA